MKIIEKKPLFNSLDEIALGSILLNNNLLVFYKKSNSISMFNQYLEKTVNLYINNNYITGTIFNDKICLIKSNEKDKIYIVNDFLKEYDIIKPNFENNEKIIDITNKHNNNLIIATNNNIYSYNIKKEKLKNIVTEETNNLIGYNNILYKKGIDGIISRFNGSNNLITAIIYYNKLLYIAYQKDGNSYIDAINDSGNIINHFYIEKNIIIKAIMHNGIFFILLITKNNKFDYIYYLS
ncbi:MAG: hypothetical protein PHD03_03465 [Bacilli bacterium]|nr:hypothetical protein [Bacilli bacterium]MDD4706198.1 hypothetical protein [Bacilli bacterium]